jgi:hypothetical protein
MELQRAKQFVYGMGMEVLGWLMLVGHGTGLQWASRFIDYWQKAVAP